MRKILLILTALLLAMTAGVAAQVTDTMTGIFDEHFRTLRVTVDGDIFAPPIISLDGSQVLEISFDHLAEDRDFLRYSLTHCNASWQPSGLVDSEFLDGFNEGTIDTYDYSRGTTVHYVHYTLTLPNEQTRPRLSGNYLLRIYSEDDPETTLLQVRFMVSEDTAKVRAEASGRTDIDFQETHQQVSVTVDTEGAMVEDPFNDLYVTVSQNGRLDSETALRQPLRMSGKVAIFEHRQPWIFEAGNEYRRFETTSVHYPGMGVEEISYNDPYYHFRLYTDAPRAHEPYLYDSTQKGRMVVREYNSDDSDIEADYVVVHFSLDYPAPKAGGETMIFLDGDLVQRRFDANSRMVYNPATGLYHRAMLLKQGAYNYQYLTVPPGARRGYTAGVEGDKYQTDNEYTIKVYHRRRGERYDRLIGYTITKPQ